MKQSIRALFKELQCCVIIPTYNNERTLTGVINDVLGHCQDLIVVDDGSGQPTKDILKNFEGRIILITLDENKGKGFALQSGFNKAITLEFRYAISIDSDGQHFPEDLALFLEKIKVNPDAMILGARNMEQEGIPGKSSFGNKFSNFWFWVETGLSVPDTQTGYRLYPLRHVENLHLHTNGFEFEIEVIVKLAWRSVDIQHIPVQVNYDVPDRVSHFRPLNDFARISLLNTYLVVLTLLWYLPLRLFGKGVLWKSIKEETIKPTESTISKAASLGMGVFFGIIPIWGFQMIAALGIAMIFKMNKVLILAASNISIPPFAPFILYGSYVLGGIMLENDSPLLFNTRLTMEDMKMNLIQYLIGSIALATAAAILVLGFSYLFILAIRKK